MVWGKMVEPNLFANLATTNIVWIDGQKENLKQLN